MAGKPHTAPKNFRFTLAIACGWLFVASGCEFPWQPQTAGDTGQIQVNVRFAESSVAKANPAAAINKVVVVVSKTIYRFENSRLLPKRIEINRSELEIVQTAAGMVARGRIRVPLDPNCRDGDCQENCFEIEVLAYERLFLLYSGSTTVCFSTTNIATAEVVLQPAQNQFVRIDKPVSGTLVTSRLLEVSGTIVDTTAKTLVLADQGTGPLPFRITKTYPIAGVQFTYPVVLFGDSTRVAVSLLGGLTPVASDSVVVHFRGEKSAILVILQWDQPGANLDLVITEPGGAVVRAASPQGAGRLLRSDSTGAGPEVYELLESDQNAFGTFLIEAEHITGNTPVTARAYVILREALDATGQDITRIFTATSGAMQRFASYIRTRQ